MTFTGDKGVEEFINATVKMDPQDWDIPTLKSVSAYSAKWTFPPMASFPGDQFIRCTIRCAYNIAGLVAGVQRTNVDLMQKMAEAVASQARRNVRQGIGPSPHTGPYPQGHRTIHTDTGFLLTTIRTSSDPVAHGTVRGKQGNTTGFYISLYATAFYAKWLELGFHVPDKDGQLRFYKYPFMKPALSSVVQGLDKKIRSAFSMRIKALASGASLAGGLTWGQNKDQSLFMGTNVFGEEMLYQDYAHAEPGISATYNRSRFWAGIGRPKARVKFKTYPSPDSWRKWKEPKPRKSRWARITPRRRG
jgi:hypothetical protein